MCLSVFGVSLSVQIRWGRSLCQAYLWERRGLHTSLLLAVWLCFVCESSGPLRVWAARRTRFAICGALALRWWVVSVATTLGLMRCAGPAARGTSVLRSSGELLDMDGGFGLRAACGAGVVWGQCQWNGAVLRLISVGRLAWPRRVASQRRAAGCKRGRGVEAALRDRVGKPAFCHAL